MTLDLFTQTIILFISIVILGKSSQLVVNSAIKLARISRLGELVIGFILLSVITNIPELSVASFSVILNNTGISIGNIIGSNIVNITLVLGIVCLIKSIHIARKSIKELSIILFLTSAIPVLLLSLETSWIVGIILIFIFFYFCYHSIKHKIILEERTRFIWKASFLKIIGILCLGLAGVLISASISVSIASNIADVLKITGSFIGATIISIGTSIPELSISISATKRGHGNLALGTVIGSNLSKLTLVLGFLLVISGLAINMSMLSTLIFVLLISNIILWMFFGRERLEKTEGIILIFTYIFFLITIFVVQISLNI